MSSLLNYKSKLIKYLYKLKSSESEFTKKSFSLLKNLEKQVNINVNLETENKNKLKNLISFILLNYVNIINHSKLIVSNLDENDSILVNNNISENHRNYFFPKKLKKDLNNYNYKKKVELIYDDYSLILYVIAKDVNDFKKNLKNLIYLAINATTINYTNCKLDKIVYFITLYDTGKELLRNKKSKVINPDEINSGSTWAVGFKPINIWRSEELVKVGIHELVHCLKFDIKNYPVEELKKYYRNFCINSSGCGKDNINCNHQIFPNEAYTEAVAEIYNCIFKSINKYTDNKSFVDNHKYSINIPFDNYHKFKKTTINSIYNNTIKNIKYEILFGMFQISKIIEYFDFKYFDDFIRDYVVLFFTENPPIDDKSSCSKVLTQNTNVFSYFFLRVGILYSLNNFFNMLERFKVEYLSKMTNEYFVKEQYSQTNFILLNPPILNLKFVENNKNIEFYTILNIDNLKNKYFIKDIEKVDEYLRNNKKVIPNNLKNTLRMSVIE
jgi:hypothetical protein